MGMTGGPAACSPRFRSRQEQHERETLKHLDLRPAIDANQRDCCIMACATWRLSAGAAADLPTLIALGGLSFIRVQGLGPLENGKGRMYGWAASSPSSHRLAVPHAHFPVAGGTAIQMCAAGRTRACTEKLHGRQSRLGYSMKELNQSGSER